VICTMQPDGEEVVFTPFARFFNGNPFELLISPMAVSFGIEGLVQTSAITRITNVLNDDLKCDETKITLINLIIGQLECDK